MKRTLGLLLWTVAVADAGWAAEPSLWVPRVFSHGAVLQRSERVPVWGRAKAGAPVTAELAGQRAEACAAPDGKWSVWLNLSAVPFRTDDFKPPTFDNR